jgi:acyl-CoA reductase-like NAD-dependent aldehyde dehydrogenase
MLRRKGMTKSWMITVDQLLLFVLEVLQVVKGLKYVCNSKEHLNHAIQMNQLASVIGSMKADTDIERAAKAAAKKADDDEKARKREEALEKVHQKKMELQPCLIELAEGLANGSTDLEKITVSKLSELLRYFFEPPIVGLTKMKRPALLAAVQERIEIYKLSRVEA